MHPLAESAGGDFYHNGGKHWSSQTDEEWLTIKAWVMGATLTAGDRHARIIQTNSAGDNVHLIDPSTNKVVGIIRGIEAGHGAGGSPDGSRIYISDEAESTLDIVDAKSASSIVPPTHAPGPSWLSAESVGLTRASSGWMSGQW